MASDEKPGTDAPTPDDEETEDTKTEDEKVDEAVEDTFPASDPPSTGGSTGPND